MFHSYKMNEITKKLLLSVDKFIPETYSKQPGFACSFCGPFTLNKERIQKCTEFSLHKFTEIY